MRRRAFLVVAALGCGLGYAEQSFTAPGPAKPPAGRAPIGARAPVPSRAAPDCAKNPDADHGFPDGLRRNLDRLTHAVVGQGTDCDDTRPWVRPGSQICLNDATVSVCQGPRALEMKCPAPTPYCARQPNDVGVCVPAPR